MMEQIVTHVGLNELRFYQIVCVLFHVSYLSVVAHRTAYINFETLTNINY